MVAHLNIWVGTACRSIGEEPGYAGLKSAVQPRLRTGLLNGDIVPGLILHECSQSRMRLVGAHASYHLAILKGVVLLCHITPMGSETLSGTIPITNNQLHSHLTAQFIEILLNSILREPVADSKHSYGIGLSPKCSYVEHREQDEYYSLHIIRNYKKQETEHRARQVMSLCPARCLSCHRLAGLSLLLLA